MYHIIIICIITPALNLTCSHTPTYAITPLHHACIRTNQHTHIVAYTRLPTRTNTHITHTYTHAHTTTAITQNGSSHSYTHLTPSPIAQVIIMMQRENCASHSGMNRIWTLDQPCGKPSADSPEHLLGSIVLRDRFDSLFVLDREVKHEALPIAPEDEGAGRAVRDVLTFEVR